ncbi:MAG: alpha/beta hydrolase [Methyloligellaceae bacterium]
MSVGNGDNLREVAFKIQQPSQSETDLFWLGGFRSDMQGTKVNFLADWAKQQNFGLTCFDYSGFGSSTGNFLEATISDWLEDALAVFEIAKSKRCILIGSSMGAWIALLLVRHLGMIEPDRLRQIKGLVLIAPAWDMTKALMEDRFDDDIRDQLNKEGVFYRPSAYDDGPYPITLKLVEDGRRHLLAEGTLGPLPPVRILHGMQDIDVPWQHSMKLVDLIASDTVTLTLVKDANHRLSRDEDLKRLCTEIELIADS